MGLMSIKKKDFNSAHGFGFILHSPVGGTMFRHGHRIFFIKLILISWIWGHTCQLTGSLCKAIIGAMIRSLILLLILALIFLSGCAPRAILLNREETQSIFQETEEQIFPLPDMKAEGRIYYSQNERNFFGNFLLEKHSDRWILLVFGPLGFEDTKIIIDADSVVVDKGGKTASLTSGEIAESFPWFSSLFKGRLPPREEPIARKRKGRVKIEFLMDSGFVTAIVRRGKPEKISFKDGNSSLILSNFKRFGGKYLPTSLFIEREKEFLEVKIKKISILNQRKGEG